MGRRAGCDSDQGQDLHSRRSHLRAGASTIPKTYFVRLHDERSAQSRLEDILGSETRNCHRKARPDRNRAHGQEPETDARRESQRPAGHGTIGVLPPIAFGRLKDRRGNQDRRARETHGVRHRAARCALEASELQSRCARSHLPAHDQRAPADRAAFPFRGRRRSGAHRRPKRARPE